MPDPRPSEDIEKDKKELIQRKRQGDPNLSPEMYEEKRAKLNDELDALLEEEDRG